MRNRSGNSPYLEILLGTAILGMLRVYSGFQENEQAQETVLLSIVALVRFPFLPSKISKLTIIFLSQLY